MVESARSGFSMRCCLPALLLLLLMLLPLAKPLNAQGQQLPELSAVVPHGAGEQATSAQLAVSAWRRADLDAWWLALRAMDGSAVSLPKNLRPPDDPAAWQVVGLPDDRAREPGKSVAGDEMVQMRWYRMHYAPSDGQWPTSVAIYMPRLVSLAAAVLVKTDAGWRPVFDNQAGAREQWIRPLWAVFPAALTDGRTDPIIEIVVAVPVLRGSHFSVSSAWLGARDELAPRFQRRWMMQIGVPQATGLTLIVLGLFSAALWVRRREEPAYLLFALASVAWLLRNLHYHLDMPRTPLGLEWFWWLTHASLSWVLLLTILFALRFARQRHALFERALTGFVVISSLMTVPLWAVLADTLVLQHIVNAVAGTLATAYIVRVALKERSRELGLIAVALMLGMALGVHDLVLLAGWAWPEHIYLMPIATLVIVATFLYAVQQRYIGALVEVEQLNLSLAGRLAEQSTQMKAQHDQLRESERQQSLLLERQRLMQDMHDGLGSSLLSAMVAVEQGSMDQDKVVEVLRECVDDLRLVIDSLEPVGHDLVSLLATMRYRLGKRLQTGGLMLEWDVHDLPPLAWLEPPDALHVLRLLQEALSNVLKHACARRVRLTTRHKGSYVEIRVEDDGDGFDIETAQLGRGLKSQQRRAKTLGGSVRVDSSPGHGTRLSLRLPVTREPRPVTPDKQG